MALILKLNEETKAPEMTEDGKIIYLDDQDDNKELPLDPAAMYAKIGELGIQNKKDRDNYRGIKEKFKPFESIDNLPEWKENADKALVTVENFNDKDWMKADKVDKLKADMKDSYEGKLTAKDTLLTDTLKTHAGEMVGKDTHIRTLMVTNKFSSSPHFVGEKKKTILPPDIGESYFGKHYKVEETEEGSLELKAYHANGDPIISKINPGEPADFEEAMGMIIDAYPNKDNILAASGPGSGGKGGEGNPGETDDLTKLKEQHTEATKNKQVQLAISLKNKIFALEHPQ